MIEKIKRQITQILKDHADLSEKVLSEHPDSTGAGIEACDVGSG